MRNPREKGKISHAEWPTIWTRHEGGESIASIARHYRCTAPAIRYILRRHSSRAPIAEIAKRAAPLAVARARLMSRAQGKTLIAPELHKRITKEISLFLVALDAALIDATEQSVNSLHDAADLLMRAAARIRIELDHQLVASGSPAARLEPERAS